MGEPGVLLVYERVGDSCCRWICVLMVLLLGGRVLVLFWVGVLSGAFGGLVYGL